MITFLANGGRITGEVALILLAFGPLPVLGGGLLFYYAWRDRPAKEADRP